MSDVRRQAARKNLRVGHESERAGVNAVRAMLERHGLVVDEVPGRADYGRDLNVDVAEDRQITGGIFGVQVKSGRSYFRRGVWHVPATPADWEYWRSSTVPIVGMVYDPVSDTIRWRNLSQLARAAFIAEESRFAAAPQSDDVPEVIVSEILSEESFPEFIQLTTAYLRATADSAFLLLLDEDDVARCRGVFNCWTLGRHDPRPLILLRHLLPTLESHSFVAALTVLAHATAHPDILRTTQNWISPQVEAAIKNSFRWTPAEIVALVHKFETLDEDGADWHRGGMGQNLWSILVSDHLLKTKLPPAITEAVATARDRAAVRLLIWFQYLSDEPQKDLAHLLGEVPGLRDIEEAEWVLAAVARDGQFDVFA